MLRPAGGQDRNEIRKDLRRQIREFLTTRRAKITPQQAGLPVYRGSNRRVTGLRREEVALLAGISAFWRDWDKATNDTATMLRTEAGRGPYDRALSDLVGELSTRSEEFRARWSRAAY
jgi:hypothetical protein